MASKKVTVAVNGETATVVDATLGDIVGTLLSSDSAVTGAYGLAQRAGLFVAGMAVQNKRVGGSLNPF